MLFDPNAPTREPFGRIVRWLLVIVLVGSCGPSSPDTRHITAPSVQPRPRWFDDSLDVDTRVDALVGEMTLEEKVSQMINNAPAIERLGVPQYNWWSEGLHGVARAGLATVFPQAIGLAAAWDEELMFDVATAISDEARAKHHTFATANKRFIYQGLTLWSPNINLFRDPRWGRGQETYGEDPFLTGRMGVQFIKGLQGDDPKYLKTVATVKHFAVHSGPEPERHEFDAIVGKKDLWETYLPQFEMSIVEAKAHSLMCAYNRIDGDAACANELLEKDILRDQWKFDGFIVSDCGAIQDIYAHHHVVETAEQAAALAVKMGTDLDCGTDEYVYLKLVDAVRQGLITEAEIDISVKRLFRARMKLGLFDPAMNVSYAQIPYSVVDSEKHRQLALKAAQKSIVLLKNENDTLPLGRDLKSIAVIGPNADQWLMLLGNYNGVPSNPVTPLRGIQDAVSRTTRVIFAQGSELARGLPILSTIPSKALKTSAGTHGLVAEYYGNTTLQGDVLFSEVHETLDLNWNDRAPRADMDDDNFSVRWSGELVPQISGQYQVGVITTCNTNVYLDDTLIASTPYHFRNEYGDPRTRKSDWIELEAGQRYPLVVTAVETYADAQVQLVWAEPKPHLRDEAIAAARAADVAVMFMGLTARMEGEEMDIEVDGFHGGDRTKLGLPENQLELMQAIHALGKPMVLVLLNGSALAINWEHENIPAIVEAWYPGQAAGTAIANVLFGDYNPAGRIPVTFYKSTEDLPAFDDYHITTQTYRFFPGEPLYPFGHGLSYTTFRYSNVEVPTSTRLREDITISATVTNTGSVAGEEVVQVYLSHRDQGAGTPRRTLVAFDRMALHAGESRQVRFELPAERFALVTEEGQRVQRPGTVELSMGGGQPNANVPSTSNVLSVQIQRD